MFWTNALALIGVLSMVCGDPTCQFDADQRTFLVCSPGDKDYILKRGLVSDNKQTYSIILKHCRISELNVDSFHGLPSLTNLDISINKIKTVPMGVFDGLTKLRYLNMSHNSINVLYTGLFDKISNLLELDLTGNRLDNIAPRVFKKVSMLFLSKNLLLGNVLDPRAFEDSDINFLLLANNNMENAPNALLQDMKELVYLNLDECWLKAIPQFFKAKNLNTLTHITLKGNNIRKIHDPSVFSHLTTLRVFNLTENSIEEINGNTFAALKKLEVLDLSSNRLSKIAEKQFQNTPGLVSVDLSDNFLTVLPVNAFRGTKLNKLDLSNNKITYLQDNFCLELRNSGVILKSLYFDKNPWQCACLQQLLREVKIYNVNYNALNYDGQQPVCVTASQFVCKRQEYDNQLFIDMYESVKVKNV